MLPQSSQQIVRGGNAVGQHKEQVEAIVAEHLNRLLKDSQRVSYIASQLSFLLEGSMARAGLEVVVAVSFN